MTGTGEAGSQGTAAAASGAAEGAEGAAAAAAAAAGAATPPATPEPGKEGQHQEEATITVGDKTFKASDVQGLLTAKIGLEKTAKEQKTRLDALDLEGKTELEKAQAQLDKANVRIAELNQATINTVVQAALDKAQIPLSAANLSLGIETIEEAAAKVQQFISDNPGLATGAAGAAGATTEGSPGAQSSSSPAGAPPGTDKEAQLMEAFKNASTPEEYAAAEKALNAFRGQEGTGGRAVL